MQKTSYSLGPKFFGTTKKSTPVSRQNPGLTKEIDVPQDQGPTPQLSPTQRTLHNGALPEIENGIHSSKNITDSTPLRIATKSQTLTRHMYIQAHIGRISCVLRAIL